MTLKPSSNHASKNIKPPIGVMMPNFCTPVSASKYRLPENKTTPANIAQPDNFK